MRIRANLSNFATTFANNFWRFYQSICSVFCQRSKCDEEAQWSQNIHRFQSVYLQVGIYISKNFALHLLYIHVMVLAENLFCVY